MPSHPPARHPPRAPSPDDPRLPADAAVQPFSRRVGQFARQIAALQRHSPTPRRRDDAAPLTIGRRLARLMHGGLLVESEPASRSTFPLRLAAA